MPNNLDPKTLKTLLVGAGNMALKYAKVLEAQGIDYITIGRGLESAKKFEAQTGKQVLIGGIEKNRNYIQSVSHAIVAVNVDELAKTSQLIIESGCKNILVEKPGGLNATEISNLLQTAEANQAKVYIAYNRRFYASVGRARQIIEEDGGIGSFQFDFTELGYRIKDLPASEEIKRNWFLANSTHVVDLAFYLGGLPDQMDCYIKGGLEWHPKAAVYSGSGISKSGALFTYHANWDSPGRWGIEIFTKKHRLVLRPLENLQLQRLGSMELELVDLNDDLDKQYKPGLYRQVQAFYEKSDEVVSLREQLNNIYSTYNRILGVIEQ